MQGANDRTFMALGGWSSPRMLNRYTHLSPTHLWQAVKGLAKNQNGNVTKTVTGRMNENPATTQPIEKTGAGNGI